MDLDGFKATLTASSAPDTLLPELTALWQDAHDDWDGAHATVQGCDSIEAAWVHAYLHRKEGDLSNAGYWYARAGRDMPETRLAEEWDSIASALLREVLDA